MEPGRTTPELGYLLTHNREIGLVESKISHETTSKRDGAHGGRPSGVGPNGLLAVSADFVKKE